MIKVDDHVFAYGYLKIIPNEFVKERLTYIGKDDNIVFVNGIYVQILNLEENYGCKTAIIREFDLNESEIKTYFCHQNQLRTK